MFLYFQVQLAQSMNLNLFISYLNIINFIYGNNFFKIINKLFILYISETFSEKIKQKQNLHLIKNE